MVFEQRQIALLEGILEEIKGLRADMKAAGKDAMENGVKDAMSRVTEAMKGTPMSGIFERVAAKMGGPHGK